MAKTKNENEERQPQWMTRLEVCDYLKISKRTLDHRVEDGSIRAYSLPGSRVMYFERNEIDQAIRKGLKYK